MNRITTKKKKGFSWGVLFKFVGVALGMSINQDYGLHFRNACSLFYRTVLSMAFLLDVTAQVTEGDACGSLQPPSAHVYAATHVSPGSGWVGAFE